VIMCQDGPEGFSGKTRCFFTDGSGKKVSQKTGAMITGWAVVEVHLDKKENLTMKVSNKFGAVSEELISVQWCEAKAILEAIKSCDKGWLCSCPFNNTSHQHLVTLALQLPLQQHQPPTSCHSGSAAVPSTTPATNILSLWLCSCPFNNSSYHQLGYYVNMLLCYYGTTFICYYATGVLC